MGSQDDFRSFLESILEGRQSRPDAGVVGYRSSIVHGYVEIYPDKNSLSPDVQLVDAFEVHRALPPSQRMKLPKGETIIDFFRPQSQCPSSGASWPCPRTNDITFSGKFLTSQSVDDIFKACGEGRNPPEKQAEKGLEIPIFF
jgi:hypothetical protein